MDDIYLTDLIDVETLQQVQDAFSDWAGVAALTADKYGVAVTNGSNFTDFCMKYSRKSKIGQKRCEQCDKIGAEIALANGRACSYYCHAGLVDFAAPIMANGTIVGSFIGGQVLPQKPNFDKIRQTAKELGIDPDEYVEAVKKVKIIEKDKIDSAAKFLYTIANILSQNAYSRYEMYKSKLEAEKSAQMKSDFLANMSHEIRTPMNSILGMADMSLREEMSPTAKQYIQQIKASGKALLTIINDILDFSKIEAGKMEIINEEYEFMSMLISVVHMLMARLGDKKIEITIELSKHLPKKLYGDSVRINQIFINLLTNAIKFTKSGNIHLAITSNKMENNQIMLIASIKDTGIGMKKEDLSKLFHSFQQVDSKRNRSIEGTGLGLAITKQLLTLMGGDITVESEYGVGTVFTFNVPQTVVQSDCAIQKASDPNIVVGVYIENKYARRQLKKDIEMLGAKYLAVEVEDDIPYISANYLFIDEEQFNERIIRYSKESGAKCVLLTNYNNNQKYDYPNLIVMKKPIYAFNLSSILNGKTIYTDLDNSTSSNIETFIAPDARLLVVDDNAINITVAKGLMQPLKANVDSACSAKDAFELIAKNKYDIIFMDHMMPEVDGVEATHIIRRKYKDYAETPIIALTANAMVGMKDMFISEGMNDFIAKPIETKILFEKIKQWLPDDKIQNIDPASIKEAINNTNPTKNNNGLVVADLDTDSALSLLGSESLFWSVLKDYYSVIEKKAQLIYTYKKEKNWRGYTIEVHALKSSSRQIGAIKLSLKAAALEKAGNEQDIDTINRDTDSMINQYLNYKKSLAQYFPEQTEEKHEADSSVALDLIGEMREAVESFDTLLIDDVLEKMSGYTYSDEYMNFFNQLSSAVENSDFDLASDILDNWEINL